MKNSMHLIEFTIENYRSIRDATTLSMVSTPLHDKNAFFKPRASEENLLNSAVIYGANASGKSSVLRGLFVFKGILTDKLKPFTSDPVEPEPFLLDESSKTKDTVFEAVFEFNEKHFIYGYSLSTKNKSITKEWLKVKLQDTKRLNQVYERNGDIVTVNRNLTLSEHGISRSFTKLVRDEELFATTLAKNSNWTIAKDVFDAWDRSNVMNTLWHDPMGYVSKVLHEDKAQREMVLSLLQQADLTITDIRVSLNDAGEYKVKLQHSYSTKNSTKSVWFDIEDQESAGTLKFFKFTLPLLYSLSNGTLLVLDEFDSTLHPDVLRFIIELFNDGDSNQNHAQLILTTHDTSVMDDLFARDQIYFTQKGTDQATELYSLSDIKGVKKGVPNLSKKYLSGEFGAVPKIIKD